ncbi:MAG: TIGR03619 family F420-dependent LLM class oxidoreductase [Gammaproteobacteria bacterium]
MKLGMNIRNWGPTATPEFLAACARAADDSTLDAIWFNDHIGLPPVIENNVYGIPEEMGDIVDPLSFGAFLAAVTTRIEFGTGVLVVPYRPMLLTNKLIASIQVLSGNRFLLGIGPGYLDEEFRALGVPRSRRGRITDETLEFLRASAADPLVEANGQPLVLKPALPLPPIYVGGSAKVAIPRAVRLGDGWMPVGATPAELAPDVATLQAQAADAGRSPLEVVQMKTLPLDDAAAAADLACAYREAGVTHLVHTQGYDSPAHYAEVVDQVDGAIRAALA